MYTLIAGEVKTPAARRWITAPTPTWVPSPRTTTTSSGPPTFSSSCTRTRTLGRPAWATLVCLSLILANPEPTFGHWLGSFPLRNIWRGKWYSYLSRKKVNFLVARPLRPYLVTFLSIASIIHSLDKIYQENNLFIQITDLAELKTNISRSQK